MKRFRSAQTGHIFLPVATSIICTSVCSMLVLLVLRPKMAYWLPSTSKISDFITFVFANKVFLAFVAIYIISPILIKLSHVTLNAITVLRSSTVSSSYSVILSRMSLVIGK